MTWLRSSGRDDDAGSWYMVSACLGLSVEIMFANHINNQNLAVKPIDDVTVNDAVDSEHDVATTMAQIETVQACSAPGSGSMKSESTKCAGAFFANSSTVLNTFPSHWQFHRLDCSRVLKRDRPQRCCRKKHAV